MRANILIVLLIIILSSLSLSSFAEIELSGGEAIVNVAVREDGGARIEDTRRFSVSGDEYLRRIGRLYRLDGEITVSEVSLNGAGLEIIGASDESCPEGKAAVYSAGDYLFVDAYCYISSGEISLSVTLDKNGAVTLYDDCAVIDLDLLYYESGAADDFSASIALPSGASAGELLVWPHAPASVVVTKTDGSVVGMTAHDLGIRDTVRPRIMLPKELFSGGKRIAGEMRDKIIGEELKYRYTDGSESINIRSAAVMICVALCIFAVFAFPLSRLGLMRRRALRNSHKTNDNEDSQ